MQTRNKLFALIAIAFPQCIHFADFFFRIPFFSSRIFETKKIENKNDSRKQRKNSAFI